MNETLTLDTPFIRRFSAYLAERFPLPSHISMVVIYFLANQSLAQVLCQPDEPLRVGWVSALGTLFLLCVFFHLRVFDEHKDYEDDCRYYPQRILSRGLITLKHLKALGVAAISVELLVAACIGRPALIAALATIFFSWIMLHEFFVRDWLRAHFILYAIFHMLITPLMAATIFSFVIGRPFWEAPRLFWAYALADFLAFSNWEISRKIRVPDDEIAGVSSYSKEFGMFNACYVVVGLRVLNTALAWMIGHYLDLGVLYYAGLIALFIITLAGILHFRLRPSRKTAISLEAYGGGYIIFFYFVLVAELCRKHGFAFIGGLS